MKKIVIFVVVLIIGCTSGPKRQDYQDFMDEDVQSPFFHVPALNQKDFTDRTWILLAESKSKVWFYDPYTLTQNEDDIITFDAYFSPREKNDLAPFNATIVGPYRQKIDCFSSNQWSETLYAENVPMKAPIVGDAKPLNGSGWVKIAPRTAMAYVRTRLCGRKFLDDQNINYFLFQDGMMSLPLSKKAPVEMFDEKENKQMPIIAEKVQVAPSSEKPPIFYEVVNNEVAIIDPKKDIRQIRINSYVLEKHFPKRADYVFTANCQSKTYNLVAQGAGEKASGEVGAKDSLTAVAFNRVCGNHGSYMKLSNKGAR